MDEQLTAADYRGMAAEYRLEAIRAEKRGDNNLAIKLRNNARLYDYLAGDDVEELDDDEDSKD